MSEIALAAADSPTIAAVVMPLRSARRGVFRRVWSSRFTAVSIVFLGLLVLVASLSPWIMPYDPATQDLLNRLEPPNRDHLLGTDSYGRDSLSRLIQGTRVTLVAAAQAIGLGMLLGIPAGLIAGYAGRTVDTFLSRVADVLLAFPPLILALAIVGILGPGLTNAMIATGVVFAPRLFRIARAAAMTVRNETYIEASRAIGCSVPRVLLRHVLPNSSGALLVQLTFALGLVITIEASISFLGLGVRPPTASWGGMVRDAFDNMYVSRFGLIAPSLMIALSILAFSVVGDGLRDALGRQSHGR